MASPRGATRSRRNPAKTRAKEQSSNGCAMTGSGSMISSAGGSRGDCASATVLAASIMKEGLKLVAAGMNPMDLKRGIDIAVTAVVKDIERRSKKVQSSEEIAQIGTVAAN